MLISTVLDIQVDCALKLEVHSQKRSKVESRGESRRAKVALILFEITLSRWTSLSAQNSSVTKSQRTNLVESAVEDGFGYRH